MIKLLSSSFARLAGTLALSVTSAGCAAQPHACPATASAVDVDARASKPSAQPAPPPRPSERHVYRLDFVLRTEEAGTAPASTSFTLTLGEFERGEVMVGKNLPLPSAATAPPGTPSAVPPLGGRQDVGMKVVATCHVVGEDVLLEVSTELSAFEPPSGIRKMVSRGNALASPGKPALVTTLDVDHGRHELTVTATRLR
jgi:hypothetical protein